MTHHSHLEPLPPTTPSAGYGDWRRPLPASYIDGHLTPAQHDQIRDLVVHTAAIARDEAAADLDRYQRRRHSTQQAQPDHAVLIAMFMLTVVLVLGTVTIAAVLAITATGT